MLKKYISFVFFTLLFMLSISPVQARPTNPDFAYRDSPDAYLAHKLINNETITYCIYLSKTAREFTNPQDFEDTLKLAIKSWMINASQRIYLSRQAQELAPILNVLDKDPNLQLLPECSVSQYVNGDVNDLEFPPSGKQVPVADLSIFLEDKFFANMNNMEEMNPFFSHEYSSPHIVIPAKYVNLNPADESVFGEKAKQFVSLRKQLLQTPNHDTKQINRLWIQMLNTLYSLGLNQDNLLFILQHELGHAFGLADQRDSVDNLDLALGTVQARPCIMDNVHMYLTCDDADGMVILLQEALKLKQLRFKSLCQDGISFSGGIEELSSPKTRRFNSGLSTMSRTYYPQTTTDGVYLLEERKYVSTYTEYSFTRIHNVFDFSFMPKELEGFQFRHGYMKMLDVNNHPGNPVPVGEHLYEIILGSGPVHKQILREKYDDNGQLLSYTLEIYDNDVLKETRTKTF